MEAEAVDRPPLILITTNDLRVFASRSRCKNSVGLNAVGAAGSAAAYGLFRWDWRLGRGGGEQVEASGRRRGRHCGIRDGGCGPAAFVSRSQAGRLAASGQMCSWHAGRMQGQPGACLGRGGWRVMVLGPASGKFGGQTGEGLCGSKDRPADYPAFPGRRTHRRPGGSCGSFAPALRDATSSRQPLIMPGSTDAALAVKSERFPPLRATPITGKALKTALLTASFDPHR